MPSLRVVLSLSLLPALALAEGVSIDHQGVGCVVAGRFPRFDARLDPTDGVARARLNFRPEGSAHWYSVEMSAAAGNYFLEQIDGAPLPVLVITTPCDGFVDSGTLGLGSDQRYTMTETTRFQCLNGPGPVNPHSETGRWSESGSAISFTGNPSIFNLSTATLGGGTLTIPMDILSEAVGVPPLRVTATWRKQ